jgi:hypothetical protein
MRYQRIVWIMLLAGCGPGTLGGGDVNDDAPTTTTTTTTSSEGTTETGMECEPGKIWCEGECRILHSDSNNCGECNHKCMTHDGSGVCMYSYCTPVVGECITAVDGFMTCEDSCQSQGQKCASGLDIMGNQCYGHVLVYSTETCIQATSPEGEPDELCDWPIPWGETLSNFPNFEVKGAQCCCTQDGG